MCMLRSEYFTNAALLLTLSFDKRVCLFILLCIIMRYIDQPTMMPQMHPTIKSPT